jgi:CheY-like chemotaxis protein
MEQQPAAVLVIDDNPDILEGLGTLFRQEGFPVVLSSNGRDALTLLQAGLRPCIIVMDLMMPVMNGFEFREAQLRDPALAHIPIIACSGVTDPAETATHLGAKALVHKPAKSEHLVALVRKHCLKSTDARTLH